MRTYGRVKQDDGSVKWVKIETDPNTGLNDEVYLFTLVQALRLNLNESPFYANYGIPAKPSIIQQIAPDFDMWKTQAQFAPYFASLIVTKLESQTPTYNINVTTNQGQTLQIQIPV